VLALRLIDFSLPKYAALAYQNALMTPVEFRINLIYL